MVRLLHSERGGYLHSDDKDFTNDGLAEVYLWNFKGKTTDLDALSSNSLFEIEVATPLKQHLNKDEALAGALDVNQFSDNNDRPGRVFVYSVSGGIGSKNPTQSSTDDTQYRLRHLNTGRLVIDQYIDINGVKMRTLGLGPHLSCKNISTLSDKLIETVRSEVELIDNGDNFNIPDVAA